jgi:hypothetical protein
VSPENLRFIIAAVLGIHGLGHGGALGALIWLHFRPADATGGWLAAKSWLFPSLPAAASSNVASAFWIVAMFGFVAAALSFVGVLVPGEAWRGLALASSIVSLVGVALFFGTWPVFNTVAAIAVNVGVLTTQLWLRWPAREIFGR